MGGIVIAFFIIILALVLVLLARALFSGTFTFIKTKTKKASATVLGKRKKEILGRLIRTVYFIRFDLGNGDSIELPVNKKLFYKENVGKSGVLTYKGSYFIDFEEGGTLPQPKPEKQAYVLNGEVIEK